MILPVLVMGVAACGGGGSGDGGNHLSTEDNLKIDQYRSDIDEFCQLAVRPTGELYDRALITVVSSVDEMIVVYKKNTGKIFHEPLKDRNVKMTDFLRAEQKKLTGCGKDGKAEAAKLGQALA
jgi:hypothetical protein